MNYQEHRSAAMASHDKRQHMYAAGGEVHDDEKQDRALISSMVKKEKRADGGEVMGRARGGKADRPRHGNKTVVNVIAPGGGGDKPVPVPVPVRPPMGAGPGLPPGAMPPGAGGPPPGLPPRPVAGMGPAMPPPGMMPPRARGGRMTGGAMSGVGRIEKAEGGVKGPMIERK